MSRLLILVGLMMALALALPGSTEATSLNEVKKLTASDGQSGDAFGYGVAVSGDTAVVGATGEDVGGAAYVFDRDQGSQDNWGEVKKLKASDAESGDQFGVSVAISGDIAVIGAFREDSAGNNAGAAYIFQRDQGGSDNWGEVKRLTPSDARASHRFGWSVAVSGDTAVIGAWGDSDQGGKAGAAYVFQRDQGGADNWGEVKKLTASTARSLDEFGYSVAVSGDTVVVGAPVETDVRGGAGRAYVFQRNQGGADNWGEVKRLTPSDAAGRNEFGHSVAVSGGTAVVGADLIRAAYVFQRDQGGTDNWGEVAKLTTPEFSSRFGLSAAASDDTAVVGARVGRAYVFQRDQGGTDSWGEVTKLTTLDVQGDPGASSVAVSGDIAVVGTWAENSVGGGAGATYVFDLLLLPKPTPTATVTLTPCGPEGCPTATNTPTPTPTKVPSEMRLVVVEPANACIGNQCQIGTGETFTLGVEIVRGPEGGYILAQTSIFYGSDITYDFSPAAADEIVWPDCAAATALKSQNDQRIPREIGDPINNTDELVSHGCLTGLLPPQPVSEFTGLFLETTMSCSPQDSTNPIELLPYVDAPLPPDAIAGTNGAEFRRPNNADVIPKLIGLTVFCGTPPPVGGIALDSELRQLPLETAAADGSHWAIAIASAMAAFLAIVGGAAWYARKRWLT